MNIVETTHSKPFAAIHRKLAQLILGRMDSLIMLSTSEKKKVQRLFPDKDIRFVRGPYFVLPTVTQRYSKELAKGTLNVGNHTLLFFGFVRPYKGLDVLIDAFEKVLRKYPDANLIIAGKFWSGGDELKKRIDTSGFKNKVVVMDEFIQEEMMSLYFNASELCIIPYLSATQSAVIPTSFAYGVPVIATDVGGNGDWVKDQTNGLLVKPNSAKELAKAIISVFETNRLEIFKLNIKHDGIYDWELKEPTLLR